MKTKPRRPRPFRAPVPPPERGMGATIADLTEDGPAPYVNAADANFAGSVLDPYSEAANSLHEPAESAGLAGAKPANPERQDNGCQIYRRSS